MPGVQIPLPGLEHLISVLKAHGLGVDPHPPDPGAPRAGDLVLGEPFDPILAAVYSRCDGGRFGDLVLFRTAAPDRDLMDFNKRMREGEEWRIQRLLQYGGPDGLAEHMATIPSLATPDGIQPVVYFLSYMDKSILPIASSVDRAFDLYAYYCEARIEEYGALDDVLKARKFIHFPDAFLDRIIQDTQLVQMLAEGRFEELVVPDPDSQEWVEKVLRAAHLRP